MENETTIDELIAQLDGSPNRMQALCIALIRERCKLQIEMDTLRHKLDMAAIALLGKEHDEC